MSTDAMRLSTAGAPPMAGSPDDTPFLQRVAQTRCPQCGTSQPRCRVWVGGPGHTLGLHPARVAAADAAVPRERVAS